MEKMEYKDHLSFEDSDTGEKIIVNFNSWIELLKGIMIEYANISPEEADSLIEKRDFKIPESYIQAIYYSHEIEYHWAMLLVHGEGYWNKGISSTPPAEFNEWEKKFRSANDLKIESFEFV